MVHQPVPPPPHQAPSYRELFGFALPLMLGMLTSAIHSLVDTAFVGQLGTAQVAATGSAAIYYFTGVVLFMAIMRNSMAFVARLWGQERKTRIGAVLGQYHLIALGVLPLLMLMEEAFGWVAAAGHFSPEVTGFALDYLSIRIYEGPLFLLTVLYASFYQALGNSRFPMLAQWGGVALNVMLDYGLIFGHWGLPALGVQGSALATVIAQGASTLVLVATPHLGPMRKLCGLSLWVRPEGRQLWEILKIGVPQGIGEFIWLSSFMGFYLVVGRLGEKALAASNIGTAVVHLLFLPAVAVGIAASSYLGRLMGAGCPDEAAVAVRRSLVTGLAYMALMGLPLLIWGEPIARLFSQDEEVVGLTVAIFRLLALLELFDCVDIVLRSALGGAGDTRFPALAIIILVVVVLYPSAWWLAQVAQPAVLGAWGGVLLYLVAISGVMYWRFERGGWKRIQLYTGQEQPPPQP